LDSREVPGGSGARVRVVQARAGDRARPRRAGQCART
jgi:hypothetical protein